MKNSGQKDLSCLAPLGCLALALLCVCSCSSDGEPRVTVAAAASLRNVMPDLVAAFLGDHPGLHVAVTYGASGTLSKQVVAGAPVDAVIFAGPRPVDELVERGLADPDSRRVIATNSLVLVAADGNADLGFDNIEELPAGERLAIGDPGSAPVGYYARQALRNLDKWEAIRHRLVLGGDVAMVLAYARRREVAAAIVYATDLAGVKGLRVMDRASGRWAPRPEVVAATIGESQRARRFIEFLESDKGQRLLDAHGFDAP